MPRPTVSLGLLPNLLLVLVWFAHSAFATPPLDSQSQEILQTPTVSEGVPAAGKRVAVTPDDYAGTNVFHTLYLPTEWKPVGPPCPIIFEYTGNYFPASGSTGRVEDAGLGFGLSGGQYIWVSLPYINSKHDDNQVTWWGDEAATIRYAKQIVPQIISQYNADPNAVFLCGFSRGAIGTNYLGLHDDQIARLWTGFITHDHFDGIRQWSGTAWGRPLASYRMAAKERLDRVAGRPYLVIQNGGINDIRDYLLATMPSADNFTLLKTNTLAIQGPFPNQHAKAAHNDRWLNLPSDDRMTVWQWMNQMTAHPRTSRPEDQWGQLIFEDHFERSESQETKDEPGNGWTTSSDKTAAGNKQVDLCDGTMHIFTHATANHATSVRHTFEFTNGTLSIRFRLNSNRDVLKLNFTDMDCKEVHAGHLFNVEVSEGNVLLLDRKTGEMSLKLRQARRDGTLTPDQSADLATKRRSFPAPIQTDKWHEVTAHLDGDVLSVEIDGSPVARYASAGFGHDHKGMIRLLVPFSATVDDLRIYRR